MPVSAAIAAPRARRPARRSRLDAVVLADEHAVRDDAVEVHVEVERPAEALHEGDRACAGADRSSLARHPALPGEDPAQSDAGGRPIETKVARENSYRSAGWNGADSRT